MSEQLVFVTIEWDGPERREGESFGPWTVQADGSHIDAIGEFMRLWHATERKPGVSFIVWLPKSPEAYDQRVTGT